jgi:hypothetical protein
MDPVFIDDEADDMALLAGLFASRRRKNQHQIACRAAQVIDHVLFDVGVDTFVNGTLLLDKDFRLRFFGGTRAACSGAIASVAVAQLAEARVLRELVDDVVLDSTMLDLHTGCLVRGLMRELNAQSPALRALP